MFFQVALRPATEKSDAGNSSVISRLDRPKSRKSNVCLNLNKHITGGFKMADKSRIHRKIQDTIQSKSAIGESRHQGKIDGVADQKIYSINTLQQYLRVGDYFADYVVNENPHVRRLDQCEKYIDGFLQKAKDAGMSAWTQQSYRSALTKLFGEDKSTIELDSKRREDIQRSRFDTESSRHFSEEKNAELVNFCRHTGLRRTELENLKPEQLHQDEKGNYYLEVKGKGGKVREAYILDNDKAVVDRIEATPAGEKVWSHVHSKCNVHGYRADYAKAMYEELARPLEELSKEEIYHCRGDMYGTNFDKEAMKEVSENLGHNRIDVIASNYLY